MPAWLTTLLSVLSALAKAVPAFLAYLAGRRAERGKQHEADLDMARRGTDARRRVSHDADSVLRDPNNRDG